jgi:hypothetical protein
MWGVFFFFDIVLFWYYATFRGSGENWQMTSSVLRCRTWVIFSLIAGCAILVFVVWRSWFQFLTWARFRYFHQSDKKTKKREEKLRNRMEFSDWIVDGKDIEAVDWYTTRNYCFFFFNRMKCLRSQTFPDSLECIVYNCVSGSKTKLIPRRDRCDDLPSKKQNQKQEDEINTKYIEYVTFFALINDHVLCLISIF